MKIEHRDGASITQDVDGKVTHIDGKPVTSTEEAPAAEAAGTDTAPAAPAKKKGRD